MLILEDGMRIPVKRKSLSWGVGGLLMREWQELLEYIDNYVYVTDKEEISIVYNKRAEEADRVYQHFVEEVGNQKWQFDIALDCIRKMDEESRTLILNHLDYKDFHFGFGMYIRNQYIYSSKKHEYFEADDESRAVFKIILTILHPYYDFRNTLLMSVVENYEFNRIKNLYQEDFGYIIENKLMEIAKEPEEKSCEEVLEELREELRTLSGKKYFKRKFVEVVRELCRKGDLSGEKSSFTFRNVVYGIAVLYPLEYQQLVLLFETDLRWNIIRGEIKSVAECRQYIDQNVGFKEEYADFLAQCFFEAFQRE